MRIRVKIGVRLNISVVLGGFCLALLLAGPVIRAQQSVANTPALPVAKSLKTFDSPQSAADTLIAAAAQFDVGALASIFGPGGEDIVFTGEFPQDKQRAADFAAEAREKTNVTIDPKTGSRAFLLVGNEDWPFPVPIVKHGDRWSFDAACVTKSYRSS